MKFIVFLIVVLCSFAVCIPSGSVVPCGTPKSTDVTNLVCENTLQISAVNGNSAISQIATKNSYCQTTSAAPDLVAAYNAASTGSWTYSVSSQNELVMYCLISTSGNVFNQTCRASRSSGITSDPSLPGFRTYIQNNTAVYNGAGTTLAASYAVQATSGFFSDYCTLQTDTTLPSSQFMPAGCVTIYSNAAAFNICQSGFMENMPSCDTTGSKYSTVAIPGFNFCYTTTGATFTPLTVTSKSTNIVNGVYVESAGTFGAGPARTSHPVKQYVSLSVSAASSLDFFFDFLL